MLRPWEQHFNVIIIPRFDYNAPSSLLQHAHTGFLVTCPIKREKSATKEALSILQKYFPTNDSGLLEGSSAQEMLLRNSTTTNETGSEDNGDKLLKSDASPRETLDGNNVHLSLVKLTKSGLLLFIFPIDTSIHTTDIVSSIIESLGTGSLQSPRWCHRIFPIQATCNLNEKELYAVVLKLVHEFVKDEKNKLARPVKYAVGLNRRGIGENELTPSKYSNDISTGALMDRNKFFDIVGSAVKDVIPDSVVDLNNPELSILVELLPLSGIPNGRAVVAVSVLASNFVVSKPKLCIKALFSANKRRE